MSLPKSDVKVLWHLTKKGPMSPVEISHTANLPPRTVSHSLKRLTSKNLCKKIPNLEDMRRPLYIPNYQTVSQLVARHGAESRICLQLAFMVKSRETRES